jgi:hypothetical protein
VAVHVTVRLADGELIQLSPELQQRLYQQLWKQTARGSIMAALKLRDARRRRDPVRLVRLSEHESEAFREALTQIGLR